MPQNVENCYSLHLFTRTKWIHQENTQIVHLKSRNENVDQQNKYLMYMAKLP